MSVHPIEFRYYSEEMRSLFTEEAKLRNWLEVEAALALAHAELGRIPRPAAAEIAEKATTAHVKLDRVKEIENEIHHDLMAMVKAMTRVLRAHSKAIGPETTLFCSHLARALCPEHSFFAPQLASQGYVLAYDGMAITVSRP